MNGYFTHEANRVAASIRALSAHINNVADEIVTGFDKLPSESSLKKGMTTYVIDTGAANAYLVAMTHTATAYTDGMVVDFKAVNANTGASTIDVDSLGVKSITIGGSALAAGTIAANLVMSVRYNSTSGNFEVVSLTAGLSATAALEKIYSQEWATKAEDSLISTAAGGNGTTDYSSLHHDAKAEASATAGASSAEAALTSENNAAATYDDFDDRYLGPKSSAPTLDNDGDALLEGALYWNATSKNMWSYDGAAWQVIESAPDATQAEMEAGTVTDNRWMNPAGVKQAIDALAPDKGWVYLGVVNASGAATADINGLFTADYDRYYIVADDISGSVSADPILIRMRNDTPAVITSSTYWSTNHGFAPSAAIGLASTVTSTFIRTSLQVYSSAVYPTKLTIEVNNPLDAATVPSIGFGGSDTRHAGTANYVAAVTGSGLNETADALSGIQIYTTTGTITGTFRVYGVVNS